MAAIHAKPFRLALLQLGPFTPHKTSNIEIARKAVAEASSSTPRPDLIVLPEIWNSPYAVTSFREYSEQVPEVGSVDGEDEGETVKAMRLMAQHAGCYLIGGSIPEREAATDHIYNCSTAYDPRGRMYGHSMVVDPLGQIIVEADENPAILYADIDTDLLATTRKNLPVTIQRRFDVYPDVSNPG
ncbi:MAG: hypothetical protein TREMPRED_000900 [Tremellales sp. Tagirdzhanova-0007]|nr:MAG: hypothetical protein TREMPRED_000900 [Tremellales sp. Tagirdzhanova-0007]